MSMFSKTRPPEPAADLPEGYDDPESPLHIPELWRELYAATPRPSRADIDARMDVYAWEQAAREAKARYEGTDRDGRPTYNYPRGEAYRSELRTRADAIKEADYDQLHARTVHQLRMESAAIAKQKHDRSAENSARMIAEQTCPRCQRYDVDANGFVDTRDLMGETGPRARHPFRSCVGCYSVKRAQMLTNWSVHRLADGRTRGDAVSDD